MVSPAIAVTAIPTGPVRTVKAPANAPTAGVAAAAPVVARARAPDIDDKVPTTEPKAPISFPPISTRGPMAAARAATFTMDSWVAGLRLANQSTNR